MAGFITGLKSVEEVEAGIFEVVVILQRGATAKLRMNAFTFQAFVTKFIHTPRPQRWLDRPTYCEETLQARGHQGAIQVFANAAMAGLELTQHSCEGNLERAHQTPPCHGIRADCIFSKPSNICRLKLRLGGAPAIGSHAVRGARKRIPNDWVKGPCQSA